MFHASNYMISLVETGSFSRDADKIFDEEERSELSDYLAVNPHSGDLIAGTGGVRKLRWAARGSGKRGGARVIYYFRDLNMPVFLLAVYGKGEKANLTAGDKKLIRGLVDRLVEEYWPHWQNIVQMNLDSA